MQAKGASGEQRGFKTPWGPLDGLGPYSLRHVALRNPAIRYGDITPVNQTEYFAGFACQCIGGIMWATCVREPCAGGVDRSASVPEKCSDGLEASEGRRTGMNSGFFSLS